MATELTWDISGTTTIDWNGPITLGLGNVAMHK